MSIVRKKSNYGVVETLDRFEEQVRAKGMTIFARVDHADGAAKVGLQLDANQVLIFGNPAAGTPLMHSAATAGIDLPLKALAWQDAEGQTWLAYNDPRYITERHSINDQAIVVEVMSRALAALSEHATK